MRTRLLAILLGAATPITAIAAPVATPPAAPVELHIDALGIVPPDFATVGIAATGVGDDAETARGMLDANKAAVAAILSDKGIDPATLQWTDQSAQQVTYMCMEDSLCTGDMGEMIPVGQIPPAALAAAKEIRIDATDSNYTEPGTDEYGVTRLKVWSVKSEGKIRLANPSIVPDLAATFGATSQWSGAPDYGFLDRAASHRAALAKGLAQARAEADGYAASIGYRVVRISRLSNRGAPFSATDIFTMLSKTEGPNKDASFMASEFAPVGVDFVLAPK